MGKKPPMLAAAMASWTQGGIPASQDATRRPVSLGTADAVWQGAMSLPLISNAGSGPAGITTLYIMAGTGPYYSYHNLLPSPGESL